MSTLIIRRSEQRLSDSSGEKTAAFKITKADIANCEISPIQGQTWTGKAIEPVLTIKNGSVTLKAGTDYEVTYSNNIDETDEAKAEITGIGNYTGTAVVYFSKQEALWI